MNRLDALVAALVLALAPACALAPRDYTAYRAHLPRSILVLPPLNETTDALASASYLSTVTEPLCERGYYVFPVAVVTRVLEQHGLATAEAMHRASPRVLGEMFGADAVMYVAVEEWSTGFLLLESYVQVKARARLVDAATGIVLWEGEHETRWQDDVRVGRLGRTIARVAAGRIVNTVMDTLHRAGAVNAHELFDVDGVGLLEGPRHPGVQGAAPK